MGRALKEISLRLFDHACRGPVVNLGKEALEQGKREVMEKDERGRKGPSQAALKDIARRWV
jgi:hypothetical protein